jgi:ADP-ribose pyrophosphatase YjhB (NUDIX family)
VRARFCMQCATRLRSVKGRGVKECRRCGWVYWNNPKPTASVIVRKGHRVLLAKRARAPLRGYWDLVGGFVEPGESAEEAAKREAREELGVSVELDRLLGTFPGAYGPGGIAVLDICYEGRIAGRGARLEARDDIIAVTWAPLTNLPKRLPKTTRAALRKLRLAHPRTRRRAIIGR